MNRLSEKVYVSGLTALWPEITRIPNLPLLRHGVLDLLVDALGHHPRPTPSNHTRPPRSRGMWPTLGPTGITRKYLSSAISGLQGLQPRVQGLQALVHLLQQRDQQLQRLSQIIAWLIGRNGVQRLTQLSNNTVWRLGVVRAHPCLLPLLGPLGRACRRHAAPAAPRPEVIGRGVIAAGGDVDARRHTLPRCATGWFGEPHRRDAVILQAVFRDVGIGPRPECPHARAREVFIVEKLPGPREDDH
jgi:hypothetical protein